MSGKPDLDDLDELLAAPDRPGPNECPVCWALAQLDTVTAGKMREVLARPVGAVGHGKVRDAIARRLDYRIDVKAIGRHRTGAASSCK